MGRVDAPCCVQVRAWLPGATGIAGTWEKGEVGVGYVGGVLGVGGPPVKQICSDTGAGEGLVRALRATCPLPQVFLIHEPNLPPVINL